MGKKVLKLSISWLTMEQKILVTLFLPKIDLIKTKKPSHAKVLLMHSTVLILNCFS
jgi:hypothetical protein